MSSPQRQLFGIIGSVERLSEIKREWNTFFVEQGMDASMNSYATTETELPERLSEMFHFDRRGYIVGKRLQEAIIPLLDYLDTTAKGEGRVDTVYNDNGVFAGYFLSGDITRRKELWLQQGIR